MSDKKRNKDDAKWNKTLVPIGSREALNLLSGCILSPETFTQILIHADCHDAIIIMDDRFIERLPVTAIAARATAADRYLYMYYFEGDAYVHTLKLPDDDKEPDKEPKPETVTSDSAPAPAPAAPAATVRESN